VRAGGGLQEGQWAGGELVLLDESDLIFPVECKISFFAPAVCTFCACVKNVMGDRGRKRFRDAGVMDNPADLNQAETEGKCDYSEIEEGMSNVKAEGTYVSSLFGLLSRSLLDSLAWRTQ
jgi:hypothetical protein